MTDQRTFDPGSPQQAESRRADVPARTWARAIGLGVVTATAANLLVLTIASATGASLVFTYDGANEQLTVLSVVLSSAAPLAAGAAMAALITRWWHGVIRLAQVIGVALALGTIPYVLGMDADGGTLAAMVVMHAIMALVVVGVLEAGRRPRG